MKSLSFPKAEQRYSNIGKPLLSAKCFLPAGVMKRCAFPSRLSVQGMIFLWFTKRKRTLIKMKSNGSANNQ